MIVRPMQRPDLTPVAALFADQYRRWNALDPRITAPPQVERAMFDLLDFEWDETESWAAVALDKAGVGGYLRAALRRYPEGDPQRMWLPAHHASCEVVYQFATRADLDHGAIFTTLYAALQRKFSPGEPWALAMLPSVAGLGGALTNLGFYQSSIFGYRQFRTYVDYPLPAGVTIRPVQERDRARLLEMFLDLHDYHARTDPRLDREVPQAETYLYGLINQVLKYTWDWSLLVAEQAGGDLVGFSFASLDVEETGPSLINRYPGGTAGSVLEFYVDPTMRRNGLGRALLVATERAILTLADRQPRKTRPAGLWLVYRGTNPTSSTFWPAMGFVPLYEMWRSGGWN